ncbi:phosphate signaling complex protein PhoU [Dermacoccaceae bacterium W4C1]
MRDAFHEDLDRITDDLVRMTELVRTAMTRATSALLDADLSLAESVIAADDDIDDLRTSVDNDCVDLLARQQPVATDLRIVVTAMQMGSSIERMGDLARHLAKAARRRYPDSAVPPALRDVIKEMEAVADDLVRRTGEAIAEKDVHAAVSLKREDGKMDELHRSVFTQLMSSDWDAGTAAAVDATLISRYFERFGDHAVSVSERIVYLVTGSYRAEDDTQD